MAGLVNGQSYEEKNVCQLVFPIILYILQDMALNPNKREMFEISGKSK